jgi:hypothetical protein
MNHLCTLYDALISIDVPADRARAVVAAMERDMAATLATKQDLDTQTILLRHDMEAGFALLRKEMSAIRMELGSEIRAVEAKLEARVDALAKTTDTRFDVMSASLAKDLKLQSMQQTIRTGVMLYSSMALLFAALKWLG